MLLSVAHRVSTFFSYLWVSSINAALSITPMAPPITSPACKAKEVLERVVLRGRDLATACGMVLITSGMKRETKNVHCGRVGVGLDTSMFTVNALH